MWYLVSIVFDEEHRTTTSVNSASPEKACRDALHLCRMTAQDVLSVKASPAVGMDDSKNRADYARYGTGPKQ